MKDSIRNKLERLAERHEEVSAPARRSGRDRRHEQVPRAVDGVLAPRSRRRALSRVPRSCSPSACTRRKWPMATMRSCASSAGRAGQPRRAHRARRGRAREAAAAEGCARRQQHLPGSARRHRRRRGGDLRRRSVSHVLALRRRAGLARRGAVGKPRRARRLQGNHQPRRRPRRVLALQVRVRHASRAARAGDRSAGTHSHLGLHRRDPAGAGRDRSRRAQSRGAAHRHLSRLRRRRSARQQDRLGDPHHAPADRHRGRMPGRTLAAQEPLARDVAAEGAS